MPKISPRPGVKPLPPKGKTTPPSKLPQVGDNGMLMKNASKYSRNAVLTAFEMIGGVEEFAEWALVNRSDFYTKMFARTIQKDVEVQASEGIESLLERLDAKDQVAAEEEMTIDAEFEMVGDLYADQRTE